MILCFVEKGIDKMSATITIRPKGFFSKKLTLKDVLPEELSYGIPDGFERLDEGKEGEYTMLFDPENIGRGFQIRFDGATTELHINYPNSRHDIELCYMMAQRICQLQKVDCFEYEGECVTLDRIEQIIQRDIDATVYTLQVYAEKIRSGESKSIIIFGAINPFEIGERELDIFGEDIDKFSEWLNEMQQRDVYYGVPHFYEKQDGSTFGAFAVKAGVASVMPVQPSIPLRMRNQFEVSDWYVLLGYSDGRKTGSLAMIDYSGLAEHISKGEYYDAGHAVVNLTDSDVEHLLETYAVSL